MDREEILNTEDYDSLLKELETNSPYKRLPLDIRIYWNNIEFIQYFQNFFCRNSIWFHYNEM